MQKDYQTYCYLIYNPITNLYKIGITGNIDNRINQLRCQSGCDLILIGYVNSAKEIDVSAKSIELFLHEYFKNKRKIGEWFDFSKKDLIQINSFSNSVEVDELAVYYK